MPITSRVMGSGVAPLTAVNIVGDFTGSLVATGSTQATALQLNSAINDVITTAASTGVVLPVAEVPATVTVYNAGANALLVYPQLGSQINALALNAGFSIGANKGATFVGTSPTTWRAILGA